MLGIVASSHPSATAAEWSIASASYDNVSWTTGGNPNSLDFSPDGTYIYIGKPSIIVYRYECGTPWDIQDVIASQSKNVSAYENLLTGMHVNADGTKLYTVGDQGDGIDEWTLSTAYDLTTATWVRYKYGGSSYHGGVLLSTDGTKLYTSVRSALKQWTLSTPWDISTATAGASSPTLQGDYMKDFVISPSGLKVFVLDPLYDRINQYTCSTAWDISTMSYDSIFVDVTVYENDPRGLFIKPDGTKMYVVGTQTDRIYQYSL